MTGAWLLSAGIALAADVEVGGNLKLFHISTYPYDNDLFAESVADGSAFEQTFPLKRDAVSAGATSSGLLTSRLTFDVYGDWWTFSAHPQLTVQPGGGASAISIAQTGTGIPQAVDLSWEAVDDPDLLVQLRADRLVLEVEQGPVRAALGRQAVTFGHGLFFTPLDLVNPFFPTVVDQEYKPGVDAARVDAWFGAGQATVTSAYRGDWELDGMVHAAYVQQTVGLWDIGLFGALAQDDKVGGLSLAGSAGPVSLHGDASITLPADDREEDPFVRAVVGAQGTVTPKTQLMGEVYVQTNGATDPSDYLEQYDSPRYARAELWLAGRTYAAVSVTQELQPMLSGSLFVLGNLEDTSALVGPGLSWNVSDNVTASLGAYLGVGERPVDYQVEDHDNVLEAVSELVEVAEDPYRSEMGAAPATVFASMQAWF